MGSTKATGDLATTPDLHAILSISLPTHIKCTKKVYCHRVYSKAKQWGKEEGFYFGYHAKDTAHKQKCHRKGI